MDLKLHVEWPDADGAPAVCAMSATETAVSPDGSISCGIVGVPDRDRTGDARDGTAARLLALYRVDPGRWPHGWNLPSSGFIVDRSRREIHAGVDRMGIHSLYWRSDGRTLQLGSRSRDCHPVRGATPRLSLQALYTYVYFHHVPSPLSIFENIEKLKRAGALLARGDGTVTVCGYHREVFSEDGLPVSAGLETEMMEILRRAVRRALDGLAAPGAFLSGGLDSSTVAGLMAEAVRPATAQAFSIGFDAEGYDETEYARIAAAHFGLSGHEYHVRPEDVLVTAPRLLGALDEPYGNSSIVAAYHCAEFAKSKGITGLLAGDGGDELFSGNDRYAKQLLFERYFTLPRAFRQSLLEPLLLPAGRRLPGTPFGKVARYIEQANVPLPDRLQDYNYLHRHPPQEVFTPRMLEQVDTGLPLQLWRKEYAAPEDAGTVNRMLHLDWAFTLHDNDLVKVNAACREAGIAVAYPMLDTELVDFSCRLPGRVKMRNGQLRGFYKHATRDFLPKAIIDKKKHGFGLPFGVWTSTHPGLSRLAQQSLESLAERGLFRGEFLRETLRLHRESHAAYYGELVWILLALETWLQHNAADYRL